MKNFLYLLILFLIVSCSKDKTTLQAEIDDPIEEQQQDDITPAQFVVTSFSPTNAYTGETVTILGDSINLNTEYRVTFNDIESLRVTVSESQIEVVIPNGEASGDIKVLHDDFVIPVGNMEVIIENAFIFSGWHLLNPNSGIPIGTYLRHPLSDDARAYVKNDIIDPNGNHDLIFSVKDIDTQEQYSYGQGNWLEGGWTGSSEGYFYTNKFYFYQDNFELLKIDFSPSTLEWVDVPSEYFIIDNFYFEDLSRLGCVITIDGQTGTYLWKVHMETGDSELVTLGENLIAFGESKDEELLAIKSEGTNQLVKIDRTSGAITEVLYDGIPEEFTSKKIMQSKSTGRYFLISPTQIIIFNPDDGSITYTEYDLDYPQFRNFENSIFKMVNF